jgi:soluble lytic murein transglycosylase
MIATSTNMTLRRTNPAVALALAFTLAAGGSAAQAADRRAELRAAFIQADSGQLDLAQASRFSLDPLYPWLQSSVLRQQIATVAPQQMQAALSGIGEHAAGSWLRGAWLAELAKREDWAGFRANYRPSNSLYLRCTNLRATIDSADGSDGSLTPAWAAEASKLWLTGTSLPAQCDAPMARLEQLGKLGDTLRWQRIDLAIEGGESGLIRAIAKGMSSDAAPLALSYAAYLAEPAASLPNWPANARSRHVASSALVRLARRDPDQAESLAAQLTTSAIDADGRERIAYQVALWTVASYLPGSARRLNAVPPSVYDERLHEWRVREAISRGDDAATLAAIGKMKEAQRSDARWQYFEARIRERMGQHDAARKLYVKAARNANFHGWLAADRLQQPYLLCPIEPSADPLLLQRVSGNAALARALDLFAIERSDLAAREWAGAIRGMSDDERRVAVQKAIHEGWFERAVSGMVLTADDMQYYSLRFPLHHEVDIRAQSKLNGLDPAWVAGQTRAESSFMPNARSGADARGLMQLIPATGAATAQRLGLPWLGSDSLYDPSTNLRLGTAYMRQMLDRFDKLPYMAIAAYNAGPTPIGRWRADRSHLDPDFFIETIPYKETRDYVSRVLAFSVIYDWRLNGTAAPLSARMLGKLVEDPSQRRAFSCAAPPAATTVAATSATQAGAR